MEAKQVPEQPHSDHSEEHEKRLQRQPGGVAHRCVEEPKLRAISSVTAGVYTQQHMASHSYVIQSPRHLTRRVSSLTRMKHRAIKALNPHGAVLYMYVDAAKRTLRCLPVVALYSEESL